MTWQHWTPERRPSVGWGDSGQGQWAMAFYARGRSLPRRGWRHSLRTLVEPAPHSHVPPRPVPQVGRNSLGCFGTHSCSLLSAKHLDLPNVQMFQHHLGMSLNPKPKLIWLIEKKKSNCLYLEIHTALLSLSCTVYYDSLCTDLDNRCPGKRESILFASGSPIPSTGPGAQKVLTKHLQNERVFSCELTHRRDSGQYPTKGRHS